MCDTHTHTTVSYFPYTGHVLFPIKGECTKKDVPQKKSSFQKSFQIHKIMKWKKQIMKKYVKSFQRTTEQEISVGLHRGTKMSDTWYEHFLFFAVNRQGSVIMIITGLTKSMCKWRGGRWQFNIIELNVRSVFFHYTFPLKFYACT